MVEPAGRESLRTVYNVQPVNTPRTIAGLEWKMVAALSMFFGFAAMMFREPAVLIAPFIILAFLSGPGKRDSEFVRIYKRHSIQRDHYSPAYICQTNLRSPRPRGFSRLEVR